MGKLQFADLGDVPLADIADLVLNVHAGAYAIEGSNPGYTHEWRIWEDLKLPDGKLLIPGVVTHSANIVEHPKLMAGTDYGFAQGPRCAGCIHPCNGLTCNPRPSARRWPAANCGNVNTRNPGRNQWTP